MNKIFENLFQTLNEDSKSLIEISEDFITQMNEYIALINDEIIADEYEGLIKTIHTLKGSVLNFDLPIIIDALSEIKNLTLEKKRLEALASLEKIQFEMKIFQKELMKIKN